MSRFMLLIAFIIFFYVIYNLNEIWYLFLCFWSSFYWIRLLPLKLETQISV